MAHRISFFLGRRATLQAAPSITFSRTFPTSYTGVHTESGKRDRFRIYGVERRNLHHSKALGGATPTVSEQSARSAMDQYEQVTQHRESLRNSMNFWEKLGEDVHWFEPYRTVLDVADFPNYKWYAGGKVNMCYECVDKHVIQGYGDDIALIYDSAATQTKMKYTFKQLQDEVSRFAGVLTQLGVTMEDSVLIYMPMVPEMLIAMLACARIGATHFVVFGGFGRHELSVRLDHAKPKVILAASCGFEKGKPLDYKKLLNGALEVSQHKPEKCVILQRDALNVPMEEGMDLDWRELVKNAPHQPVVPVDANHALYVLYTSGTTGVPKGIVREQAGNIVTSLYVYDQLYACRRGEVFLAAVDLGWAVGHACTSYGPLLRGAIALMYEGKPVGTPNAGALWRLVEEYKVHSFLTAPTALRIIRKEDPDGEWLKKYDLTSLKNVMCAGERLDVATSSWLEEKVNASCQARGMTQHIPVHDNWWQTESGYPITHILTGLPSGTQLPAKSGSCGHAIGGWDLRVLDDDGAEVPPNVTGNLVLRLPLPPGSSVQLWNNPGRFQTTYLSKFPGYYNTGDLGMLDEEGYCIVSGRSDDVINVSAYRFSTLAFEELLTAHPSVSESVVVGVDDEVKGQVPVGILVLSDSTVDAKQVEVELVKSIRSELGAIASFNMCLFVPRLPKTKSGKTLRKTISQIACGKPLHVPGTIEDITVIDEIKECFASQLGLPKTSSNVN